MSFNELRPTTVVLEDEALTLIKTIQTTSYEELSIELVNSGNSLDQFVIGGMVSKNGTLLTLRSTGSDYTAPSGMILETSGDLTTLAGAPTQGYLVMLPKAFRSISFFAARAAGADTTLILRASLKRN